MSEQDGATLGWWVMWATVKGGRHEFVGAYELMAEAAARMAREEKGGRGGHFWLATVDDMQPLYRERQRRVLGFGR